MIVLDTHVWVWWVHGNAKLPKDYAQAIGEARKRRAGRQRYLVLGSRQARRIWTPGFAHHARRVDEPSTCISRYSLAESNTPHRHRIESTHSAISQRPSRSNHRSDRTRIRL